MRTLRNSLILLMSSWALAGCTSVTGGRPTVPSEPRSLSSIGDRPFPVETGEPGAKVVAEDDIPPPRTITEQTVTGRVVDAHHNPMPNAQVRIAVGTNSAGRDVAVATDEAGRFTLPNLRSGSEYTVIAEVEDDAGEVLSGRKQVKVPRSQVEIVLADPPQETPLRSVGQVSRRRQVPAETPEARTKPPSSKKLNEDDLPPPREADALLTDQGDFAAPKPSEPARAGRADALAAGSDGATGWRKIGPTEMAPTEPSRPRGDRDGSGRIASFNNAPMPDDDIPDPLPPAREPSARSISNYAPPAAATAAAPLARETRTDPIRSTEPKPSDGAPARPSTSGASSYPTPASPAAETVRPKDAGSSYGSAESRPSPSFGPPPPEFPGLNTPSTSSTPAQPAKPTPSSAVETAKPSEEMIDAALRDSSTKEPTTPATSKPDSTKTQMKPPEFPSLETSSTRTDSPAPASSTTNAKAEPDTYGSSLPGLSDRMPKEPGHAATTKAEPGHSTSSLNSSDVPPSTPSDLFDSPSPGSLREDATVPSLESTGEKPTKKKQPVNEKSPAETTTDELPWPSPETISNERPTSSSTTAAAEAVPPPLDSRPASESSDRARAGTAASSDPTSDEKSPIGTSGDEDRSDKPAPTESGSASGESKADSAEASSSKTGDTEKKAAKPSPFASDDEDTQTTSSPPRRRTWGELSGAAAVTVPALALSSPARRGRDIQTPVPAVPASTASLVTPVGVSPSRRAVLREGEVVRASCNMDRQGRLLSFELPDVVGQPVKFQDLGADFILIDFWGTWCGPCLKAIPHLVDLQKKYGPEKLKVVGIAYEHSAPGEAAKSVAATAKRLGINYTLLLGSADGKPCPLQTAFRVQAFPTLVLLDREGRVLWRDMGADPTTLARLERVLAAKTKPATDLAASHLKPSDLAGIKARPDALRR